MVVLASGARTGIEADEMRDLFALFDAEGKGLINLEGF